MGRDSPIQRRNPEAEITLLTGLPHSDLTARWKARHGGPPPKGLSRKLLLLALTYRVQADMSGDLDRNTDRHLHLIARNAPGTSSPQFAAPATLSPGMRLMREWNGRTHVVDVTVDGLLWNGKPASSLSAIARAITGARWSGPRFFGLRGEGS